MVASITISEEDQKFYRMVFGVMVSAFIVIVYNISAMILERQTHVEERIDNLESDLRAIQEDDKDTADAGEDEDEDEDEDEGEDEGEDEDEDEGEDEDEEDEEDTANTKLLLVSPISDIDVDELNALKNSISQQVASIQSTIMDHTGNIETLVKKLKRFDIDPSHYQAWLGDAEGDDWSLSIKMVRKELSSFITNDIWSSWDGTRDGSTVNRDRCVAVDDLRAWGSTEGGTTKKYCMDDWTSGIDITVKLYHDGKMTPEEATARLKSIVGEKKLDWKRTLVPLSAV
jgi:hypothetical protein